MIDLPECRKRRGGPEHHGVYEQGNQMNGQVCHRIAAHHGDCLFDRPPEFEPVREEARPLTRPPLHGPGSLRLVSTWKDR